MSASLVQSAALWSKPFTGQGVAVKSLLSEEAVFNLDLTAATQNPTDPGDVVLGTSTNHGNVVIQPAPDGTTTLDLYVLLQGGLPATYPTIRAFGEVTRNSALVQKIKQLNSNYYSWLDDSLTYTEPGQGFTKVQPLNEWVPLGTLDGDYNPTLGDATSGLVLRRGAGDYLLKPQTLFVKGVTRVLVTVATAIASGSMTRAALVGYWGI